MNEKSEKNKRRKYLTIIEEYYCPQCGDVIEPDDPKGDGVHLLYRCGDCNLDIERF